MSSKPKYSKERIIKIALELVSAKGIAALNSQELEAVLNTSELTGFKNIEDLKKSVRKAATYRFEAMLHTPYNKDMTHIKQIGMQTILFSMNEPMLFQYLFMQPKQYITCSRSIFEEFRPIKDYCMKTLLKDYPISCLEAKVLLNDIWVYIYGICSLCASAGCRFTEDEISRMLTDKFQAFMVWIKIKNHAHKLSDK